MIQNIKILGTGKFLPKQAISSASLDEKLGLKPGRIEKMTGLKTRYFVQEETASDMAINAINMALKRANLSLNDIDCIIAGSGTMEQAIPYNAASILKGLNPSRPIHTFDINMTCLSAMMAFDIGSRLLLSSHYRHILIVASDVASAGLNWSKLDAAAIFGDGAAAFILGRSETGGILASKFETYSEGFDYCVIPGCGSKIPPSKIDGNYKPYGQFQMQGKEVYRLAAKIVPTFVDKLLESCHLTIKDIQWVVPHQASQLAIRHIQKILQISNDQMIDIYSEHGNQVATSIPTAMHELFVNRPLQSGDKILLLGTSAGMSVGGLVLEHSV